MNRFVLVVWLATVMVLGVSCDSCDKKGDGGGGAWAVGENGAMINVAPGGSLGDGYNLEASVDLLGITCRGSTDAFVVGEGGLLLRTFDAGESWSAIDTGHAGTLRAVAAAHDDVVYVAGDELALVSIDSGDNWRRIPDPGRDLVGVATDARGAIALLASASGEIRLYDIKRDETSVVREGEGVALRAVAMTPDRRFAVAVGDGGLALESHDGGHSWQRLAKATNESLHDVWITAGGETVYAVGDGGVVVTMDRQRRATLQVLATPGALRSLHISADGTGMIVGDGGAGFRTLDRGVTWQPVYTGTTANLYAVDDVHPAPHL